MAVNAGIHDDSPEPLRSRYFGWLVLGLCTAALYSLLPLWVPLVLACWVAAAARPLVDRAATPHRRRRAAVATTLVAVCIVLPTTGLLWFLFSALMKVIHQVTHAEDQSAAVQRILTEGVGIPRSLNWASIVAALKNYSGDAIDALNVVTGITTRVTMGITIFILATYAFLSSGRELYAWLLARQPFPRVYVERLAEAFLETGRGLFLGIGATALIQGLIAGVAYSILGVPLAPILALLTAIAALIPVFGTAVVWVPLSVGFLFNDEIASAGALLAVGGVIAIVDNLLRPFLTRKGDLQLPTFVVFVAMLGGLAAFGGWGMILGPLAIRLAVEGLNLSFEPA